MGRPFVIGDQDGCVWKTTGYDISYPWGDTPKDRRLSNTSSNQVGCLPVRRF